MAAISRRLSVTVDQGDLRALLARLGAAHAEATLRPPMEHGLAKLQTDLATYPPASHARQPAKSRKQQIKQIMLAKEGKIPYRRTGNLGRAWLSEIGATGTGLEGTLGNATSYGSLVESQDKQASYHKGTWQTDQMVLDRQKDGILRDFQDAIEGALAGGS